MMAAYRRRVLRLRLRLLRAVPPHCYRGRRRRRLACAARRGRQRQRVEYLVAIEHLEPRWPKAREEAEAEPEARAARTEPAIVGELAVAHARPVAIAAELQLKREHEVRRAAVAHALRRRTHGRTLGVVRARGRELDAAVG